ncbi:MAG: hypothetical protein AAFW70_20345, partial [Cyanobacteria bacterium J06635_10]
MAHDRISPPSPHPPIFPSPHLPSLPKRPRSHPSLPLRTLAGPVSSCHYNPNPAAGWHCCHR